MPAMVAALCLWYMVASKHHNTRMVLSGAIALLQLVRCHGNYALLQQQLSRNAGWTARPTSQAKPAALIITATACYMHSASAAAG